MTATRLLLIGLAAYMLIVAALYGPGIVDKLTSHNLPNRAQELGRAR